MQSHNNKDNNESNSNSSTRPFKKNRIKASLLSFVPNKLILFVKGLFVVESIHNIQTTKAQCIICPTPAPPAPAPPPLQTSSRSRIFSQSASDPNSISSSTTSAQSASDPNSISSSTTFAQSASDPNSVSRSNVLPRSTSNGDSISESRDEVLSQSKTEPYVSASMTANEPSHTLLFNAINDVTRTQMTLGLLPPVSSNPLERLIPANVAQTLTDVGIGSGIISSLILPTYPNTVFSVLRTVGACKALDAPSFPLVPPYGQVALGSSEPDAASMNGAIIVTTGLLAAIFVPYLLTGYLHGQTRPNIPNKWLVRAAAAILAYYGPNIIEVMTSSIGHFSGGSQALAIIAMMVWQSVFFWTGYQVYQKASKDEASPLSLLPFYESARDFDSKPIRLLVFADMGVANILAILAGVKPDSQFCGSIASSMLVVSVGYLSYLFKFRPHKSNIELLFVTVNILFQIVLSGLNLVASQSNDEKVSTTIGAVELAALCYSYAQMALLIMIEVIKKYQRYQENAKLEKASTESPTPGIDNSLRLPDLVQATNLSFSSDDLLNPPDDGATAINMADSASTYTLSPKGSLDGDCHVIVGILPQSLPREESSESDEHGLSQSPERAESSQHSDSISERQDSSQSPKPNLNNSAFKSQLLEEVKNLKPGRAFHDSPLGMFYRDRDLDQTETPSVHNDKPTPPR